MLKLNQRLSILTLFKLHSNTTLVKVKFWRCQSRRMVGLIQIQLLLKLNFLASIVLPQSHLDSNTTLVKVKFGSTTDFAEQPTNSNTTLVKVKYH